MLLCTAPDLTLTLTHSSTSILFLFRSLSLSRRPFSPQPIISALQFRPLHSLPATATSTEPDHDWDLSNVAQSDAFDLEQCFASTDLKHLHSPNLEVRELDELPEQWRRSKLAWLCKELPSHKSGTLIRILNAQKKWMRQEDATYVAVHCMRIRENEAGFRVYKWMMQHRWYRFDFALATKLADYMGKERKFAKCRELMRKEGTTSSQSFKGTLILLVQM